MVKKIMRDPLFPVRWKSYIDKVGSYQGEIVSKSEVLKKFESKVKRSQSRIVSASVLIFYYVTEVNDIKDISKGALWQN